MELLGKNALVTGASRGIGRAIATGLAREGANVVINYYNSEAAVEEVKKDIEKSGRTAIIVKADVSKKEDVEKMTQVSLDAFNRVDILVNCSGIYHRSFVADTSEEVWDRTIAINLKGTFLCCRSMIRSMIKQKSGKIVNITSGRGIAGAMGGAAYSASKAGIIGFTKSLALEVAPYKINVNAVAP